MARDFHHSDHRGRLGAEASSPPDATCNRLQTAARPREPLGWPMTWDVWLALGFLAGMLTERGLYALQCACERYVARHRARCDPDEFWSER